MSEARCPRCGGEIKADEYGDLVTTICLSCGWKEEAMVARVFPEMPRAESLREVVIKVDTATRLPAQALHALRSLSPPFQSVPPTKLIEQLVSPTGVSLGVQAEYRVGEIQGLLEPLGFKVLVQEVKNEG